MRDRLLCLFLLVSGVNAQQLRSLKTVPVPQPADLATYISDRQALVALGKALFWDMQAGSDGRTACATCHFHAGADHRLQNQIVDPLNPFSANLTLESSLFPFRLLSDPTNRNSQVVRDLTFRAGSSGLFRRKFIDITPGEAVDVGEELLDTPEFSVGELHVRRVTKRNTPTVFNSVFNVLNFWDGRANRFFNGLTVNGNADESNGVLVSRDGSLSRLQVRLNNSSLASQAVGPALDDLEMSYHGRSWPKLGKKMLNLPPLAMQRVAVTDSVLGAMSNPDGPGLASQYSYLSLIKAAFKPEFWESAQLVDESGAVIGDRSGSPETTSEFTQAEFNFVLFWGLSLQAYQATLVSDDTPLDRFAEGNTAALTPEERAGMQFFQSNAANCNECHIGTEFTAVSFSSSGGNNLNNHAFIRTGVRPVAEDTGRANGDFKTSGLRNIEFTGPYFHNGGQSTLEQVVEFYMRGGDFLPVQDVRPFNANATQKASLVAFMKALTDERVRFERAPFDHPELCVPDGHPQERAGQLIPAGSAVYPRSSTERWVRIPAVGAEGNAVPLQTFDELLRGIGNDGSRAHAMNEACVLP